jgi:hypothetical protein
VENERLTRQLVAAGAVLLDGCRTRPPVNTGVSIHTDVSSGVLSGTSPGGFSNINGCQITQTVDLILEGSVHVRPLENTILYFDRVGVASPPEAIYFGDLSPAWWEIDGAHDLDAQVANYALARIREDDVESLGRRVRVASQHRRSRVLHDFWIAAADLPPELAGLLFASLNEFRGPASIWALAIRNDYVLLHLARQASLFLTADEIAAVREFSEFFLLALAAGAQSSHLVALGWKAIRSGASRIVPSVRAIGTAAIARLRMLSHSIQRHAPPAPA